MRMRVEKRVDAEIIMEKREKRAKEMCTFEKNVACAEKTWNSKQKTMWRSVLSTFSLRMHTFFSVLHFSHVLVFLSEKCSQSQNKLEAVCAE